MNSTTPRCNAVRPSGHIVAKQKSITVTIFPLPFESAIAVWIAGDFKKLHKTAADLGMTTECSGGYYGVLSGESGVIAITRALRRNRDARKAEINEIERVLLSGLSGTPEASIVTDRLPS